MGVFKVAYLNIPSRHSTLRFTVLICKERPVTQYQVGATQKRHFAVIVMLFRATVGTSRNSSVNDDVVGLHVRSVRGAKADACTLFFQAAIKIAKSSNTCLYLTRHYATITRATASFQAWSDSQCSTVSASSAKRLN
jgi:hypothetical protein